MSSDIAIDIQNLSKHYALFNRPEDRLKQMVWRNRRRYYREVRALSDVTLQLRKGETVGIVGRNGSGKSTLLQILSGTLQPTSGTVMVKGRVAALLELGAGFNREFTGRENIYMNAAILGFSDAEIDMRYDDIMAFADIGSFIDSPVKTYSSGMYARLAFAVASSVDPDILVVDEALSVGDEAFQHKCFSRLREIRERGATILFVSHSSGSVVELCDRAVLLHGGKRILTGHPKRVIGAYQKISYAQAEREAEILEEIALIDAAVDAEADDYSDNGRELDAIEGTSDSRVVRHRAPVAGSAAAGYFDPSLKPLSTVEYLRDGAEIQEVIILDENGVQKNVLTPRGVYSYTYKVVFLQEAHKVRFGMMLKALNGTELGGTTSHPFGDGVDCIPAGKEVLVSFKIQMLPNPGTYFLNAGVVGWVDGKESYLHRILDAVMIRVESVPNNCSTGYVDFSLDPFCTLEVCDATGVDDPEPVRVVERSARGAV